MSWDAIRESKASGDYTKIEAGKPVTLHIIGDSPKIVYQHEGEGKPIFCDGGECPLCKAGAKRQTQFMISVLNMDSKKQELLKKGVKVFEQIDQIRRDYGGSLSTIDLKITRSGSGKNDTRYLVVPIPTKYKPSMIVDSDPGTAQEPLNAPEVDVFP